MKLLSGNSNLPLSEAIAACLDMELTKADIKRFSDEEVWVEIKENVRGEDVFLIQPTSFPANDNVMELLVCIDALRRASFFPDKSLRQLLTDPYHNTSQPDSPTSNIPSY